MPARLDTTQLEALRRYAAGEAGTRHTLDQIGLDDYADLVIALAQNDLDLPRPTETSTRLKHIAAARAILQPRLSRGRF